MHPENKTIQRHDKILSEVGGLNQVLTCEQHGLYCSRQTATRVCDFSCLLDAERADRLRLISPKKRQRAQAGLSGWKPFWPLKGS